MQKLIKFYRCRVCWTIKAVDEDRPEDHKNQPLDYISCAACNSQAGYEVLQPPGFTDWAAVTRD